MEEIHLEEELNSTLGTEDKDIRDVQKNLYILGCIRENQKLTTVGKFNIDNRNFLVQMVMRSFWGDGRETTVDTIDSIIKKAIKINNSLIKELKKLDIISPNNDTEVKLEKMKKMQLITSISKNMNFAKEGLTRLSVTYEADINIVANIRMIIQEINNFLHQANFFLKENGYIMPSSTPSQTVAAAPTAKSSNQSQQQQQQQQSHQYFNAPQQPFLANERRESTDSVYE